MVGLPFSLQIATHIAALRLVQSYLPRGEGMLEFCWGVGIASTTHPAQFMATGEGKEHIARFGRMDGYGGAYRVVLMVPAAPEQRGSLD